MKRVLALRMRVKIRLAALSIAVCAIAFSECVAHVARVLPAEVVVGNPALRAVETRGGGMWETEGFYGMWLEDLLGTVELELTLLAGNDIWILDGTTLDLLKVIRDWDSGARCSGPLLVRRNQTARPAFFGWNCDLGRSVRLVNADGELVWRFEKEDRCIDARPWDLDGDGETEFYLAGFGGLQRQDWDGTVRWVKEAAFFDPSVTWDANAKVWYLAAKRSCGVRRKRDRPGTGEPCVSVYRADGSQVAIPPGSSFRSDIFGISQIDWPTPGRLFVWSETYDELTVVDHRGTVDERLQTVPEGASHVFRRAPDPVTISACDGPGEPHLVVSRISRAAYKNAILSVFDERGTLLYQELLPGWAPFVVDSRGPGARLLVGGLTGEIWSIPLCGEGVTLSAGSSATSTARY